MRLGASRETASATTSLVTVIVPARDDAAHLARCLQALAACQPAPLEVLVVDDGSTDATADVARAASATLLRLPESRGPAAARNAGALAARSSLLFFTDADVRLHADALGVAQAVLADPDLDAVIGSYDDAPGDPGFLSQYRNLAHHHVHQTARAEASTFWTGCGAVRRERFLQLGGFNEGYATPCIEDIEFGARLRAAGRRIRLCPTLLASHDKRWTLGSIVGTDVLRRGSAWIALMLRDRALVRDLNLELGQRLATITTGLLLLACAVLMLQARWLALLPLGAWIAAAWLIAPRRASTTGGALDRLLALAGGAAVLAAALLAREPLAAAVLLPVLLIVALDRALLGRLARLRGARFAFAAVPLRLLYFTCCLVSVPLGVGQHVRDVLRARRTLRGPAVRSLQPLDGGLPRAAGERP